MRKSLGDKREKPLRRNSATSPNKRCKEAANKPKRKHCKQPARRTSEQNKQKKKHNRNTISTWITWNQKKKEDKPHRRLKDPELRPQCKMIEDNRIWDSEPLLNDLQMMLLQVINVVILLTFTSLGWSDLVKSYRQSQD